MCTDAADTKIKTKKLDKTALPAKQKEKLSFSAEVVDKFLKTTFGNIIFRQVFKTKHFVKLFWAEKEQPQN
jgi:hypothetical protein